VTEEMKNKLKASVKSDSQVQKIMKQIKEGKTWKFFLQDGLLFFGN